MRIGAMGDVLHALPAAAAMRNAHPEWSIGWVIEPRWCPLLRATTKNGSHTVVNRVYLAETQLWKKKPFSPLTLSSIANLRRQMRQQRFDLCVDMQGSIRSAIIGRMASASDLAGPAEPREAHARWLYTRKVQTAATHVVEQGCELLGRAIGMSLEPAEIDFPVDREAERVCDAMLRELSVGKKGFALIAPTAGWGAKQWPAERFGAVAAELGRKGVRTVVNASAPDDSVARKVADLSGGFATTISGGLPQLIELTRQASIVIAGDTGPLHLAASLRKPVVALFGPTDPARNGPYGTTARVLRHGGERRDHRRLTEPEPGLLEITVEEVVAAAEELL